MVVPQKFRDLVLHLGHLVPWVGHLGRKKTTARISPHFFWHNLRRDVDELCRSWPEYEFTAIRETPKAPLEPLLQAYRLSIWEWMRLGYWNKARQETDTCWHDYATRYPEVFPLKRVRARNVALCLVQLFSRSGFPPDHSDWSGIQFIVQIIKTIVSVVRDRARVIQPDPEANAP